MDLSKVIALLLTLSYFETEAGWRRRRRSPPPCSPVHCQYRVGAWSPCGCNGKQSRSLTITRHPSCGGRGCPPTTQYANCKAPVVHCQYSVGAWSPCGCNGKQSRSLTITRYPSCGGNACPPTTQYANCQAPRCKHGSCDPSINACKCLSGYIGKLCDKPCPQGKFGEGCSQSCPAYCPSQYGCDPKRGFCNCPVGKTGRMCQLNYTCRPPYRCQSLQASINHMEDCFMQMHHTKFAHKANSTCPHNFSVYKCHCFKNCQPAVILGDSTCQCRCKSPSGYYIPRNICCPK